LIHFIEFSLPSAHTLSFGQTRKRIENRDCESRTYFGEQQLLSTTAYHSSSHVVALPADEPTKLPPYNMTGSG